MLQLRKDPLASPCPPFCLSVCLHLSERAPLDEVLWNLTSGTSMKTYWKIPNFFKIVEKYLSTWRLARVSLSPATVKWRHDLRAACKVQTSLELAAVLSYTYSYCCELQCNIHSGWNRVVKQPTCWPTSVRPARHSCLKRTNFKYRPTATRCSQPTVC